MSGEYLGKLFMYNMLSLRNSIEFSVIPAGICIFHIKYKIVLFPFIYKEVKAKTG